MENTKQFTHSLGMQLVRRAFSKINARWIIHDWRPATGQVEKFDADVCAAFAAQDLPSVVAACKSLVAS